MEFEQIVADHMKDYYFASSNSNSNSNSSASTNASSNNSHHHHGSTINDLISYVRVYVGQDENEYLVGDQFSNELSLVFLQFFTWRKRHQQHGEGGNHDNANDVIINATSLRDEALLSDNGKTNVLGSTSTTTTNQYYR